MSPFWNVVKRNFRTSLAGSFAGIPMIVSGAQHKDYAMILYGVGLILTGLFASDARYPDGEKREREESDFSDNAKD